MRRPPFSRIKGIHLKRLLSLSIKYVIMFTVGVEQHTLTGSGLCDNIKWLITVMHLIGQLSQYSLCR